MNFHDFFLPKFYHLYAFTNSTFDTSVKNASYYANFDKLIWRVGDPLDHNSEIYILFTPGNFIFFKFLKY